MTIHIHFNPPLSILCHLYTSLCSATSYMAAMLRDGGDLDSADRSMLDAESVHERMFRCEMMMMT